MAKYILLLFFKHYSGEQYPMQNFSLGKNIPGRLSLGVKNPRKKCTLNFSKTKGVKYPRKNFPPPFLRGGQISLAKVPTPFGEGLQYPRQKYTPPHIGKGGKISQAKVSPYWRGGGNIPGKSAPHIGEGAKYPRQKPLP